MAIRALTVPGYPTAAGYCQMWARMAYEHAIGRTWDFAYLPSARQACLAFKNTRYVVPRGSMLEPGDVLYKQGLPGQFGHVGIYVGGGMVAENSTIHYTTSDARGLRTLKEFGAYTLAVRYPAP
jgi:cell wall-associated NlpC family hydrolase